jgi:hypothetical protein
MEAHCSSETLVTNYKKNVGISRRPSCWNFGHFVRYICLKSWGHLALWPVLCLPSPGIFRNCLRHCSWFTRISAWIQLTLSCCSKLQHVTHLPTCLDCVWNVSYDASSADGDTNLYVIIGKALHLIFNIKCKWIKGWPSRVRFPAEVSFSLHIVQTLLGPTQPSIQLVLMAISLGKAAGEWN